MILLMSCDKKNQDSINVYLLKSRKRNLEGISLEKTEYYKINKNLDYLLPYTTYDSLNQSLIYASNFNYSLKDLHSEPIIKNEDIISLDTLNNLLVLNNKAGVKLLKMKPSRMHGEQFVMTLNNLPALNGHILNPHSSNGSTWISIQYDDFKTIKDTTLSQYKFSFFIGDGTSNRKGRKRIEFSKYPKLITAFKDSKRLVDNTQLCKEF
ncbi:hypothetical protein [Flavobacterium urocaniciphilum]|uniref:hypothetical protein n=1 Tax=Flavobacterium urocaniciphilum TaxID=1299341 RepID=UPI00115FF129|nr:hypothetical protein [Flavobacterium urocaniciphilum]